MRVIVTGGCGFIGSSFVNLLENKMIDYLIIDNLTYASNINNIPNKSKLIIKDICEVTPKDLGEYDYIVNFAAESHVDNSIKNGLPFVKTNIQGTYNLLEVARKNTKLKKFIQISTDEVYGDLEKLNIQKSKVGDSLNPSSYYSATKASADMLVQSCAHTFGIPYLITRTCNNFGNNQNDEKFIPTIIKCIKNNLDIPIYGDGKQIREWIWVEDNVKEIYDLMITELNGIFHIGSGDVKQNIEIINYIGKILNKKIKFKFVEDRLGHDRRYTLESNGVKKYLTLYDYLKKIL
jgi:dTDP-glucose 4,6-dehydratase